MLGLGASGPQVIEGFHGLPYDKPLGRTREVIRIVRSGLKREPLQASGIFNIPLPADQGLGLGKPLKILVHPERDTIPIWVASLGDKNVEMTAELADGWLPILFIPERAREVWGASLDAGAAKRDPELGPLQVSAGGMVAIGEDVKGLLDFLRPMYALYVGGMGARGKNFYNELAQHYGYEKEAKEIQDLYLDGKKKEAEALVPMEWMEQSNLVGPASYVQERIAAFKEAGVSHLSIVPATENPAATDRSAQGLGVMRLVSRLAAGRAGGSTTSTRSGPSTPTTTPTATGSSPSPGATTSRGTGTRARRSPSCATTASRRSPGCSTAPVSSRTTASSGTTTPCSSRRRRSSRASSPSGHTPRSGG